MYFALSFQKVWRKRQTQILCDCSLKTRSTAEKMRAGRSASFSIPIPTVYCKIPHHCHPSELWPCCDTMNASSLNTKQLAGINATNEIESLLGEAIALASRIKLDDPSRTENNNDNSEVGQSQPFAAMKTPRTTSEAVTLLMDYKKWQQNQNGKEQLVSKNDTQGSVDQSPHFVPIPVLCAVAIIFQQDQSPTNDRASTLDRAIRGNTSLVYVTGSAFDDDKSKQERQKFQERLKRLRLKQEEFKYTKLTHNVLDPKLHQQQDEINTKSMTYAASIGLNMIVAPLSFGCFMYYFSGNLLGWIFPKIDDPMDATAKATVDIRRVIVSVLSGVIMLFIEMILFVIRTHEVDKAMRSKQRKQQQEKSGSNGPSKAFGYYTANTERHYKDR